MKRRTLIGAGGLCIAALASHAQPARKVHRVGATGARASAVFVSAPTALFVHRQRVVDLVAKYRLPAVYELRPFVDAGGLMSYGADINHIGHHAATYVDKILKGAKPADLPVQQPTRFEPVINMKTAKALGITIAYTLRLRADEVIE